MTELSAGKWARLWFNLRGRASRAVLLLCLLALPAAANTRVSIELVLAVDVSLSVNDIEYDLQMSGIAAALRDPEIIDLIGSHEHAVAICMTQWSGTYASNTPLPWRVVASKESILALAAEIEDTPRSEFGNFTALGHAVSFAINEIRTNAYEGDLKKIDVSGDGRNNSGPEPAQMRKVAQAHGVTINGLAITNADPELAAYYEQNLIAGPASFVISADNFESYAEAFKKKLKRELTPSIASRHLLPTVAEAWP
jgi:hypothetical protein